MEGSVRAFALLACRLRSGPRPGPTGRRYGSPGADCTSGWSFLTITCKIWSMRITEAARRLEMTPRMLRYRESLGLLPALQPGRRAARGRLDGGRTGTTP